MTARMKKTKPKRSEYAIALLIVFQSTFLKSAFQFSVIKLGSVLAAKG
jgi:hypothetical protein